jgi:hypothetical protein
MSRVGLAYYFVSVKILKTVISILSSGEFFFPLLCDNFDFRPRRKKRE